MAEPDSFSLGYSKTVTQKCLDGEGDLILALFYMQYEHARASPSYVEKKSQHGELLNWYYHSGEKVYGPYPASAMASWYKQKKLKANLLVRKGNAGMFVMLKHLTEGHPEDYDPFGEAPKAVKEAIMKDAYGSLISVVAAMRITQ